MASPEESLRSVLVTGGCGFQGYNLVCAILEAEPTCKVYAFDIDTNRPSRRHAAATYLTGDISDASAVDNAFAQMNPPPRVIFHTACPPSMDLNADLHWRVNVSGTRNILAAADRGGSVLAFVHTSTASVGYDGVAELKYVTELPVLPASAQSRGYSRSKGVSELEVLAANRRNANGMLTCAIRPCTTFGADDPVFMQSIVDVVRKGQAKYRFGKGTNLFDFIYIDNACHAHILAARHLLAAHGKAALPVDQRVEGEAFNVTNDEAIPFWDLTLRTSNLLGSPIKHEEVVSMPLWLGLAIGFLAEWSIWLFSFGKRQSSLSRAAIQYTFLQHTMNIDKIKDRLGYKPRFTLQEGIERAVE